jgi:hypothetical protein
MKPNTEILGRIFTYIGTFFVFLFLQSAFSFDPIGLLGLDSFIGDPSVPLSVRRVSNNYLMYVLLGRAIVAAVIVGATWPITAFFESNINSLKLDDPVQPNPVVDGDDALRELLSSINKRVDHLTGRSTLIYWTIILSLVTGVFLIIFAGRLSSFDSTLNNINNQLSAERQDAIKSSLVERFSKSEMKTDQGVKQEESRTHRYLGDRVKVLDDLYGSFINSWIKNATENTENKPDWNWPGTVLRIGIIGLLVFLTQILVTLYRYNSRLVAFYNSRRDALLCCGKNLENIQQMADRLFYPANLDFGREPRHPFQEAADLLQKGGNAAFGRVRKAKKATSEHRSNTEATENSPAGAPDETKKSEGSRQAAA